MNKKMMLLALCMLPAVSLAQDYTDCFIGTFTAQNKRAYQEDRFFYKTVCCPGRPFRSGLLLGVFDGHHGSDVPEYLRHHFEGDFAMTCGCVEQKMKGAFGAAEKYSLANYGNGSLKASEHVDNKNAFSAYELYGRYQNSGGSTAVTAYIDIYENIVHFAWVGNSRAVLESNGAVAYATQDHTPNAPVEQERIEIAGRRVDFWSNGLGVSRSSISRSIGDYDIKAKEKWLIATPEYKQLQLTKDNNFLVMASSGLWDVMDNEEVVQEVASKIEHDDVNDIAQHLGDMAIQRGSQNNITILIIKINWFKQADVL